MYSIVHIPHNSNYCYCCRIAARTGRRGSLTTDDVPELSSRLRNGLQSLLSERILSLVLHMNIVTSGLDGKGCGLEGRGLYVAFSQSLVVLYWRSSPI